MMRLIIPIILILVSGGLYYFFTDPIINEPRSVDAETGDVEGGIKALMAEKSSLDKALDDIQSLQGRAQTLETTLSQINDREIEKLDVFLPDAVEDIQLIIDVETIAQQSGMQITAVRAGSDVQANQVSSARNRNQEDEMASGVNPQVANVSLSFSVIGTYGQLRAFLDDLGRSLRVLDVSRLSFSTISPTEAEGPNRYQYDIELKTYWLK